MNFHFKLLPVDEIAPWGKETPSLHWFGLTMGWFWITARDQELFRYTDAAQQFFQAGSDSPMPALPYEDYPVARYWEDLIEMLPSILDPIPDDIAVRIQDSETGGRWQEAARGWMESDTADSDTAWETYYAAVGWWGNRTWDAGHLAYPPRFWLWRTGDTVLLRWDNRAVTVGDNIPVWTATYGEITVSVTDFIASVTSFDARFLDAMAARVETIRAHWSRPEIALDIDELIQSQKTQSTLLQAALNPFAWEARRGVSWDQVREAMSVIELSLSDGVG
jgi:hypothetical protein